MALKQDLWCCYFHEEFELGSMLPSQVQYPAFGTCETSPSVSSHTAKNFHPLGILFPDGSFVRTERENNQRQSPSHPPRILRDNSSLFPHQGTNSLVQRHFHLNSLVGKVLQSCSQHARHRTCTIQRLRKGSFTPDDVIRAWVVVTPHPARWKQ
jgi:hypothetical protein